MNEQAVPPLGQLVEKLSGERADVASLTRILTGVLADALPAGIVEVAYRRSVSDRMHGRPGTPTAVTVDLGESALTMSQLPNGRPNPELLHQVKGIVLSRQSVSVAEWVQLLAEYVQQVASQDREAREVLSRLLFG